MPPALGASHELPDVHKPLVSAALIRRIDAVVEAQLEAFNLPGAAVAVVHRGEVLHSRGYGFADIEAGRRFDSRTVFRTASVSKPFTAIAVMQLVERGKIDLDENVNAYLDIPVPDTFPAPVTMRHLLTHTAGFDDRMLGSTATKRRLADTVPLRELLTSPDAAPRVRPPGKVISYSNHGMALAGYVVEVLSGLSFADYIDTHIHEPLGMGRSTFRELLPERLAADRAMSYRYRRGEPELLPITYENAAPADSQFSTADDMVRFMLANLDDGSLDGARILEPETLRRLHATAFTHHPVLPGWTLGFIEYHWNGYRLVGHGGDLPGYHSQLSLLPEAELGVFVHFNGIWDVQLDDDPRMHVVDAVLAALVPVPDETAPPRAPDDRAGALRAADGEDYLVFDAGGGRSASHLFATFMIPLAFERVRWYENELVLIGLMAFSALMFFGATLGWPIGAVVRRFRRVDRPPLSPARRQQARLERTAAVLGAVVVVLLATMMAQVITLGDTPLLSIQPVLAAAVAACGLSSLWLAVMVLRS